MGPRSVNFSEEDKAILSKVNGLLKQLHVESPVESVTDIGAGLFVTLFEGLCGEQLSGILRSPSTREDEIHNCQVVIDSLAGDVLHTSLTHIGGAEIIDGSREAISNLLEIFSGLLEYMLNKIDSDASTDNDDDDERDVTTEDPDRMTRDQLDEILELELRRERLLHEASGVKTTGPTAKWVEESSPGKGVTSEKDELADRRARPHNETTGETTADLISESEEIERRLAETRKIIRENAEIERKLAETRQQPDPRQPLDKRQESDLRQPLDKRQQSNLRQPLDKRQELDNHEPLVNKEKENKKPVEHEPRLSEGLSKERENRSEIIQRLENDPRYKYMLPPTSSQTRAEDEETDETFRTLQNMVEETAAMARAAVNCNPDQAKSLLQTMEKRSPSKGQGYRSEFNARSRREKGKEVPRNKTSKRASPSNRRYSPKPTDRLSDTELTPSKAKRKVSFLDDRSLTDSSPDISRASRRGDLYGSYSENTSYQDSLKKKYEHIVTDMLSDEEGSPERQKTAARRSRYQQLANKPRALYTLGQTQKLVQEEKSSSQKKIGFLQKIYREDLDELMDEADYLLHKNRETAKEKEKEYQKKMLAGVKTKPLQERQGPSVLKKKTRSAQPRTVSSKVKKTSSGTSGSIVKPVRKNPMTIKDDEDLLPMLLEEFPHLHLSLHTWHELWRKGLQQIEQITRAHQEVHRKKSHAQDQLEEAEKRQEIMVNIVRKELEHEHRLKEIKERQASAISSRNKLHERRIQSARARGYYDEYQVRMRSKMLKRRTREEMIFKKLFQDGLEIQKERIRELRKYAKEHRDSEAKTQRNQIESMENYYRDQFHMLAENISKEKQELVVREKAQTKVLGSMKKELRKKMESEIRGLQEQLVRDDDDVYFRQLDSDRVIHDLKVAKYQVRV